MTVGHGKSRFTHACRKQTLQGKRGAAQLGEGFEVLGTLGLPLRVRRALRLRLAQLRVDQGPALRHPPIGGAQQLSTIARAERYHGLGIGLR